jgi:hypothetical protein
MKIPRPPTKPLQLWDDYVKQSLKDHPTVICIGCGKETENRPGMLNYCEPCRTAAA